MPDRAGPRRVRPAVERRWLREPHPGAPDVELPLVDLQGAEGGPTVAIMAGMHAGEYSGVLAALQLIQRLGRTPLRGRVLVIPIISVQAFYQRNMQLSPVDQREVHYVWPGDPSGSYSAHLIDLLFRTVRVAQAVIDLHGGEFVQELKPYVAVPWERDGELFDRSLEIARSFAVPFVDKRPLPGSALALPLALYREGIPNVWTEIGHNGLTDAADVRLQAEGCLNVLGRLGLIAPRRLPPEPRLVGPKRWSVVADRTGLWLPEVRAGQHVSAGQVLGRMVDPFGDPLRTFEAPADALVEYVCTSPAIDNERRPHGNSWHQHLVQLAEDPRAA